jgi:hypothetical protein
MNYRKTYVKSSRKKLTAYVETHTTQRSCKRREIINFRFFRCLAQMNEKIANFFPKRREEKIRNGGKKLISCL